MSAISEENLLNPNLIAQSLMQSQNQNSGISMTAVGGSSNPGISQASLNSIKDGTSSMSAATN